ncbi:MAG: hypothetical protein WCD89_07595 [Anaerocolumna sp.]
MNEIYELYLSDQEKKQTGTHVFSTDEMTGIKALEHKYPDKLPVPGACAKIEFEYIRHGTTSLIGFFDVALVIMYPTYLNQTRTEEDFYEAVRAVTLIDPKGAWVFPALSFYPVWVGPSFYIASGISGEKFL